ncbi:MAG: FAD-linked oxidase C-terminal domain-containing protein [Gammaproteobacteria bacterium]|nr:FAD-linked oxidase C-terminal domain-containing protein [Gammaproteobacteria bacterium]MDX2487066.1 FAD-linked oxidase C-terminal domain-containing protein [Gammaproteobacteria bacterium]
MSNNAFIEQLTNILPAGRVLSRHEDLTPYECDALTVLRERPLAVAIPETEDEILKILEICRQHSIAVVTRGAGTGLSGGARPVAGALLISMMRFNRILEIDEDNLTALVEPGVRNLSISEAVADKGLYYAPDPSSQIACSIGGNVAENAGGVHCLKYGLTVHNIVGMKIITMDGQVHTLGNNTMESPGYDLTALMNGSEGMLAIITEIRVLLRVKPPVARVILAAFDDIEQAGDAVSEIIKAGILPAGLEMMDGDAIRAAEDFAHAGYPLDAQAILLCELDGLEAEVSTHTKTLEKLLHVQGATEVRVSKNDQERQRFWAGRKAAFPAVGRISPDYYVMDGTIPRAALGTVLKQIGIWSEEYGLSVANVFHAGDGNLHPLILYDGNVEGEVEKAEELGLRILKLSVELGGTITGEHGVGVEKLDAMCDQFNSDELALFHAVKEAFDPQSLLNPGKAVPSLHRCAELGAMHVHNGELPFPELDRF